MKSINTNSSNTNNTLVVEGGHSESETSKPETENSVDAEWKQFLKEYESWVNKYAEIVKKYKENPSDISILSDYTKMMGELTKWATRADKRIKDCFTR